MKYARQILLIIAVFCCHMLIAEEAMAYLRCTFTERTLGIYKEGRSGTSVVKIGKGETFSAFYYTDIQNSSPVFKDRIKDIEWLAPTDTTMTGYLYRGKSSDGTYFIEKIFKDRPSGEGIILYQVPEDSYEKLSEHLRESPYIPLELFHDTYLSLMDYQLVGVGRYSYEEGREGCAYVVLHHSPDSTIGCHCFYFQGAMMGTPLYLHQIENRVFVQIVDSGQPDNKYSSSTGRISYGKAEDGTYFVEKLFYANHQGIIFYCIPEMYYEEVLLRLVSLPCLSNELFAISKETLH